MLHIQDVAIALSDISGKPPREELGITLDVCHEIKHVLGGVRQLALVTVCCQGRRGDDSSDKSFHP